VLPRNLVLACLVATAYPGFAQAPASQPQVKVNVLNVCTPSVDDQKEIASALKGVPQKPSFSPDFELDRGRSLLDPGANPLAMPNATTVSTKTSAVADFVRIRHDLTGGAYSNVQYSFSRDEHQMVETLVFRVRDPKDLMQVSIEDSASSVTPAATMLSSTTPASRIKLERFGKSSVVLARCTGSEGNPVPDQSAYDPLFASASSILTNYRVLLNARRMIPDELSRVATGPVPGTKTAPKTVGKPANKPGTPKK
jgi:hypothetical protein